jgi:predicted DNA-binding transcriptional regulator AlpA
MGTESQSDECAAPPKGAPRAVRVCAAIPPAATNFDRLPDSALVAVNTAAAVLGIGVSTAWAKAQRDPTFPQFRAYGPKCTRTTAGEIRRYIAGKPLATKARAEEVAA